MDYRNERDALRGRVENLEEKLQEAKKQLQGPRSPRRGVRLIGVVVVAAMGLGVGAVVLKRHDPAPGLTTGTPPSAAHGVCASAAECCRNYYMGRTWRDATSQSVCEGILDTLEKHCSPAAGDMGDACQKAAACMAKVACNFTASEDAYCEGRLDYYRERGGGCALVPPAPRSAPVAPPPPEPPPVESAPAKPPRPATPRTAPRSAKPRWSASVRRAEGIALARGTPCFIEAVVEATGTNARVSDLELRCGGQTLYRKGDSFAGMAKLDNDAREQLGPRDDQSTFTLQYNDVGTRTGARSQLDFDSTKRSGVVFRETSPRWRVELTMPVKSQPTAPLSGVGQRLRRHGRVTTVSGAAIVSPGAICSLRAMPTGNGEACVADVRCGALLFPAGTDVRCTYDGARPIGVASAADAPTLRLDGQILEVQVTGAKASRVVISLELE